MKKKHILFVILILLLYSCHHRKNEINTELYKPSGTCLYSRNEQNPSGKKIRVVQSEKFISMPFTDKSFNGKDFLSGYLSCVSVDTVLGVYFDFNIHTEDAFLYYGMIKKNNTISFILESGKTVKLTFGSTFSGNTNLSREYTEYSSFAYLPNNSVKQLMSEKIGKVSIAWSKKDEDYDVVNPQIFIDQIPCVK